MKSRIALTIIVAALSLCGCVVPKYNYRPNQQRISFPEIGKAVTVNVGDEMLRQGVYTEIDAIELARSIKIGVLGSYTLGPGIYNKKGESRKGEFYMPDDGPDGGTVSKSFISDPWQSIIYSEVQRKIGVVTIFGVALKTRANGVRRVKRASMSDESFQQTLIYNGKIGSNLRLGYREFSNDLARPAFNNDVEYDLDESRIVGYKGARIEILDATNQAITYKVISNFK